MKKYEVPTITPHKLKAGRIMAGSPFNTNNDNNGGIKNFEVSGNDTDVEFE